MTRAELESACHPITPEEALDGLRGLYDWLSMSAAGEETSFNSINAAIEVLKKAIFEAQDTKKWNCRFCEHLKDANRPREKYIGMCEYRDNPDTCSKFELAHFYEGHDPRK